MSKSSQVGWRITSFFLLFSLLSFGAVFPNGSTVTHAAGLPAFPGAEGWGAESVGGRGGKVIEVTNLNDAGIGSLRACIEASGARICVFRVGGTIELQDTLKIENPFITVAGQTAPGGGITLKNSPSSRHTPLSIETHDVIFRYIRSRPGPPSQLEGEGDAIAVEGGAKDVIIDHTSVSWAIDENVQIAQSEDVTYQWSITSEALDDSMHEKGPHSMGLIVLSSDRTSIHHNLFANNNWRNPRLSSSANVINNVIYNTGGLPDKWSGGAASTISVNAIGNIWIDGPSTVYPKPYAFGFFGTGIYVEGNILPERPTDDLPEEFAVPEELRYLIVDTKFDSPDIITTSALEAYDQIIVGAGASAKLDCQGNFVSNYDAIDQRIINDVINGTGAVIDHPDDVGGWVSIPTGTPCTDTDSDGMADDWENTYFASLAQGSSSDSSSDFDSDGYTDLEEFLNGTDPTGGTTPPPPPPPPGSPPPVPPPPPGVEPPPPPGVEPPPPGPPAPGGPPPGPSPDDRGIGQFSVLLIAIIVVVIGVVVVVLFRRK